MLLLFNFGAGEVLLILLVILLFFGSKRIPDLARTLGKGMRQIKDASQAIQRDITDSVNEITNPRENKKE